MELEDKAALEDIRDTKGPSNKTSTAKKHFDNFLAFHCEEKDAPVVTEDKIPCHGLRDTGDCQKWWDNLFGKFFDCVTFRTHQCFDKDKPLALCESATGCASAMESSFEKRFRGKPPLAIFTTSWRSLRNVQPSLCKDSDKRVGDRSVRPRNASSNDDRKATAKPVSGLQLHNPLSSTA